MTARRFAVALTGFMLAVGPLRPQPAAAQSAETVSTGTLRVRVVLVASDLSLKPVPKSRFVVTPEAGAGEPSVVSTSFDGVIETPLAPGAYRLRSESPTDLEGKRYSWDVAFEIAAGSVTTLELSNDNAHAESASPAVTDDGALYARYKDGVFRIISDEGHGSGFLVSADGLVLTNHHVVADVFYLAVEVAQRHKVQAVVVAEDPKNDLAVLRVHPDAVRDKPLAELAEDAPDRPPVSVGDRVLAIGSPLSTQTILTSGVVSKVEEQAIFSDVTINPGNSGGPLFSARGVVVGINTFGVFGEQGAGVSGITRIYLARPLLAEAVGRLAGSEPPSSRLLPSDPAYRFPPETVKAMALAQDRAIDDYHVEAGKLDLNFLTPALFASLVMQSERQALQGRQKRKEKQRGEADQESYEPGEQFYEWQKDEENFRAVVRVRIYPEVNLGSAVAGSFIGRGKLRFKTDFERMELARDGAVVEPIHPGRMKEVVSQPGFKDVGYWGYYEYSPEAFAPGANSITATVWEQDVPEPRVLLLPPALVERIRSDMAPYFESLAHESGADVPPGIDTP